MKKLIRSTALAALLIGALPAAQAATYSFSGMMDSGSLLGASLTGSLSFDNLGLTGNGFELFNLSDLSISFAGQTYTLANADVAPDVSYQDGVFLGLSYSASALAPQLAFIAGSFSADDAFVAYTMNGLDGAGSISYTAAVPEPESYAMLLAGLGLMGLIARRRSTVA